MIFIVAFLACGAVHWANSDSARSRAEARAVSRNILTGALILALAQAVSLARLTS
jgi:hypothetical protein